MKETLTLQDSKKWRNWLQKNWNKQDEVWLIYYKKHTGKPSISYEEAVMEALAYGWIDGKVNTIDSEKYMQRFTPRRKGSVWSETNLKRVKKLIKEKRMTAPGLEAAKDVLSGRQKAEPATISKDTKMPKELEKELKKYKKAWANFDNFSPSTKKLFFWFIESAKRPETRERRLKKAIKAAKDNNKFGYM